MAETRTVSEQLGALLNGGQQSLKPDLLTAIGNPLLSKDKAKVPYDMDDADLVQASMTALLLGQPLILAGSPGVGKTQFAVGLANRLGLRFLAPHQVKSSDEGRDLLYSFDQVGRYRSKDDAPLASHIDFTALGLGILLSAGPEAPVKVGTIPVQKLISVEKLKEVLRRDQTLRLKDLFPTVFRTSSGAPDRCIVLLDELDKAPRDAPNDILGEIERMRFRIQELDIQIEARPDHWPVVIITTNSEQSLPDAFLRRCIFHWIVDPKRDRLIKIVALHLTHSYGIELSETSTFLSSAVDTFLMISKDQLNKRPATAEFVSFVFGLVERGMTESSTVKIDDKRVRAVAGTLLKTRSDRNKYFPEDDGK